MANVQKKNARGHRRRRREDLRPAGLLRRQTEAHEGGTGSLGANGAGSREWLAAKRQENVSRIVGVAIFALSVIFFFVAVRGGDGAWKAVHNVYLGLFGVLAAVLFPILAVAIILLYSYKENKAKRRAMEEGTGKHKGPPCLPES